ncbi:MAG TPA: hypothetical protein VGT41_05780 [Candidatus Babeliales bacterium]|nr:hypothetical protein [Candidatus Babeliales bacterium]
MKKLFLIFLIATMNSAQCSDFVAPKKHGLGDALCATVLFVGGAWLAHKQLPRLVGQKIEFDAPIFTRVFASILFAIGIVGGVTGAHSLVTQIRDTLNDA